MKRGFILQLKGTEIFHANCPLYALPCKKTTNNMCKILKFDLDTRRISWTGVAVLKIMRRKTILCNDDGRNVLLGSLS